MNLINWSWSMPPWIHARKLNWQKCYSNYTGFIPKVFVKFRIVCICVVLTDINDSHDDESAQPHRNGYCALHFSSPRAESETTKLAKLANPSTPSASQPVTNAYLWPNSGAWQTMHLLWQVLFRAARCGLVSTRESIKWPGWVDQIIMSFYGNWRHHFLLLTNTLKCLLNFRRQNHGSNYHVSCFPYSNQRMIAFTLSECKE